MAQCVNLLKGIKDSASLSLESEEKIMYNLAQKHHFFSEYIFHLNIYFFTIRVNSIPVRSDFIVAILKNEH